MKTGIKIGIFIFSFFLVQVVNLSNPMSFSTSLRLGYALTEERVDYDGYPVVIYSEDDFSEYYESWDEEFVDDSEQGTEKDICPNGGYKTTGVRYSKTLTRYRVKVSSGATVSVKLFTSLEEAGAFASGHGNVEVNPVVCQEYWCKDNKTSRVCWVCNMYIVSESEDQ